MLSTVRNSLVFGAFAAIAVASAHANLLTNPGAETGDLSGWVAGGVFNPLADNGTFNSGINPQSGSFAFLGGSGAFGTLTQTVSIVGNLDAQVATISFWEQSLNQGTPSDNGFVSLAFLNNTGTTIGAASSPTIESRDLTWQQYTGSYAIPVGTASIAYTMNFVRNYGTDLDAYIDNNTLSVGVVPEPETYAMLLAGLGLIGATLKRRKSKQA